MLKIRTCCFETNSSSMDRYDDYDSGPTYSYSHQYIWLSIRWRDEDNSDEIDEVMENLEQIEDKLLDLVATLSPDGEDFKIEDWDDETIYIYSTINGKVYVEHPGYEGDRYCPPEPPVFGFDFEGFPYKNEECPARNKLKDDILKLFHEHGWNQVAEITEIYGEEPDYDEFNDNIRW